jgi:hypothetical protein
MKLFNRNMKLFVLLAMIVGLLAACGANEGKKVKLQSPIVAGQQQPKTPVIAEPVIKVIDQFCTDDQFNQGFFEGYYMGRELQIFTGQQLKDISQFREFCKKPKEERTPYDYGYISGRVVDSLVVGIVPYLGRDAIALLRAAGLIF